MLWKIICKWLVFIDFVVLIGELLVCFIVLVKNFFIILIEWNFNVNILGSVLNLIVVIKSIFRINLGIVLVIFRIIFDRK